MSGVEWTHREGPKDHRPDPHYNVNGTYSLAGKPSWWTCHKCGDGLLLGGKSAPVTGKYEPIPARSR